MTDINGLTNPFENSVYNMNLTQLEKEKQIRDYLEAITHLDYTVPTDIIVSLNQLIAEGAVSLDAIESFNLVLLEAFANMDPVQFLEFTPDELLGLSAAQIAALGEDVFAAITFDLLSALSLDALGGVQAAQIAQISVDVFSQLTFEMFSALSPDALAAITPEQIAEVLVDVFAVMTGNLLSALSDGALAGVTAAQIAAFPAAEFATLTAAELTFLSPDAFAGVTADQIAALPADVFATLTGDQIAALSAVALGGATADQLATLDPAVLQALQDAGKVLAITSDGDEMDGDLSAASFSIQENSQSVAVLQAASPLGLPLSYSLAPGDPDAALFQIDAGGNLSFRAAPDFESPQSFDSDNVYEVTVRVSDGVQSDAQTISVTVTNDPLDDNVTAPAITSNGGGGFASVQVQENQTAVTTVTSFDPDPVGDRIYSIAGGDDQLLFNIDAQSGALSFVDAPDFETPQSFDGDNLYDVTVAVSDGLHSDTQQLSVEVQDVDEQEVVANVQLINPPGAVGPREFIGTQGIADVFVFDTSVLSDGLLHVKLFEFDIFEDYLVFYNYDLDGDNMPTDVFPGHFDEVGPDGANLANFTPYAAHILQLREYWPQSDAVIQAFTDFGFDFVDLSAAVGFDYSSGAVTEQTDHVLLYGQGFEIV